MTKVRIHGRDDDATDGMPRLPAATRRPLAGTENNLYETVLLFLCHTGRSSKQSAVNLF